MDVLIVAALGAVVLAIGVIAVVAVGVGGRYAEKNPAFTKFASTAVDHLNGDAEPPRRLADIVER